MIAIETKYLSATNTKPSRIKAFTCNGQSLTMGIDGDSQHDQCLRVAQALVDKMVWGQDYHLVGGGTKDGYTFVFVENTVKEQIIANDKQLKDNKPC